MKLATLAEITKTKRNIIAVVLAAMLLVLAGLWVIYGYSGENGNKAKGKQAQAPIVNITAAIRKDVPVYLNGLGTVQAYNTVTIHSRVDGQLIEILFKEGQDVNQGDVLAKLDPRTYLAQLDQAMANQAKDQAQLENAQLDLKRYIKLGNTVSGQVLDNTRSTIRQLEATIKSDQAAIDNVKTLLSYTTIASPIDGRTGIRLVDVGNIVHPGDANGIVVITQLSPISVIFSLPQQNLQNIIKQIANQGQLVVQAVRADDTILDSGVLELVDNQIDQSTGTIKLKATFPNKEHFLWPGGFTNVRLLLNTRQDSIVVPSTALQRGPKTTYVFILNPDKTVAMRNVKMIFEDGNESVLEEGVSEGELVVTDGATKLADGTKVRLPEDVKDVGRDKDGNGKSLLLRNKSNIFNFRNDGKKVTDK
jgi:multidrug efflux system membrane fusion protein